MMWIHKQECHHEVKKKSKNEKSQILIKEALTGSDAMPSWWFLFQKILKPQQIIFEPSYPFLDNLSTLGHITSLIKSILIEKWLL